MTKLEPQRKSFLFTCSVLQKLPAYVITRYQSRNLLLSLLLFGIYRLNKNRLITRYSLVLCVFFQEICSGEGRGKCECGKCKCEAKYTGKFCEECPVSCFECRLLLIVVLLNVFMFLRTCVCLVCNYFVYQPTNFP